MSHTPGPWTFVPAGNRPEVTSAESWLVCRVQSLRFVDDACLISAAPDMFEALKGLVSFFDSSGFTTEFLSDARAALTKAQGLSPESEEA